MEKRNSIEYMSDELKYLIRKNLSDVIIKSDIIDDCTFIMSVYFKYGFNYEVKYVYHIDNYGEYICMISDNVDFKKKKVSWTTKYRNQIGCIFSFVKNFYLTRNEDMDEDLEYYWTTFICNDIFKIFNNKNTIFESDIQNFPKYRIIHQSSKNITVILMTNLNRAVIFTVPIERYNLRPDKDLMRLVYEDLKEIYEKPKYLERSEDEIK